jgi:hypothetical protein
MILRACSSLLALGCLSVSLHSSAAEEYSQSIPTELAKLLLDFNGRSDFAIYDGIMDDFPDFDLPSGFTVTGSLRQSGSLRLALATSLSEDEALSALGEVFLDDGWVSMPEIEPLRRDGGFVTAGAPAEISRSPRFCRDNDGFMTLSYGQHGNDSYVLLGANNRRGMFGFNSNSCQAEIENLERSMSMRAMRGNSDISGYIPRMELPGEQTENYNPFGIVGMSGSSREMSTEVSIEIDWGIDAIYEHIAEQINRQQWNLDSDSIGEITATGTWLRNVDNVGNFIGTLTVTSAGDNRFDLKFVIRAQGGRPSNTFIRAN